MLYTFDVVEDALYQSFPLVVVAHFNLGLVNHRGGL
jgi:hypothetical protein